MPRQPRREVEPGVHHVFSRGNRKALIYADDVDRGRYLTLFGRVASHCRWRCLAYCLMGNHVHHLIETRTPNLGKGLHQVNGTYAQYFNRRHGLTGHLFEDRFNAIPVTSDAHLAIVARYIARNPVEAGLCRNAEDWPWGSYAAILSERVPPWLDSSALFSYLGATGDDPMRVYTELVRYAPRVF